ncbi:MAG: tryptophan synthase subunit alpha [Syntrophales bacterium]|jgi:tryptophan synthase alpha chain|nr:tryptophan synthase subunit alpha [Syntrophales bacterium]MDD5531669.1 tryptophan synthase subunit alpha [Syntrophales bacterium]
MNRIGSKFAALRQKGEKGLIAYITAGDPDFSSTREIVLRLEEAGVDLIELGIPFSDPTADGPVIQAASGRALAGGATPAGVISLVKSIRAESEIPLILFSYYNPIFCYGCREFAGDAAGAGADGLLVVDLPPEESRELRQFTDPLGMDFISLIAPTTGPARARKILGSASGFAYYIAVTAVTGTTRPDPESVRKDISRLRRISPVPVVAGFGISTPQDAAEIAAHADGIVVGSALVGIVEKNSRRKDLALQVASFAREIGGAIRTPPSVRG